MILVVEFLNAYTPVWIAPANKCLISINLIVVLFFRWKILLANELLQNKNTEPYTKSDFRSIFHKYLRKSKNSIIKRWNNMYSLYHFLQLSIRYIAIWKQLCCTQVSRNGTDWWMAYWVTHTDNSTSPSLPLNLGNNNFHIISVNVCLMK